MEAVLKQAIRAHQSGDVGTAIPLYEKYLKAHPGSAVALSNLGASYARIGRYEDAIAQYRRALKVQPANPSLELNLGLAHYKAGQLDEAAVLFEKVHRAATTEKQPLLLLADTWLALGKYKEVDALLTPMYDRNPEDQAITYLLGTALVRGGDVARGQIIIDRILKKGDSAEARLLLGATKLNGGDYPGALADLETAVKLNPDLPDVYSYYGRALQATGDPTRAADAFRKALSANPNSFTANLELAVLLKSEQKLDEAAECLRRALRVRPKDLEARFEMASVDLQQGRLDASRQQLERITKEAPAFTAAHVTLATVYYRLKRKADGDRERAIVQRLTQETQAQQQKGMNVK